ncbi:MAG: hypothetical protein ABI051_03925 [Vicinamibacterales bacterium]
MAELTYLMNRDPAGDSNQFYSLAKQFFQAAGSTVVDAPAIGQTLEGVFKNLKSRTGVPATINLVSHASGFASMECPVNLASQAAGRRTMTVDDLQDVLAAKSLAPPGPAAITNKTRIVIYGCDVGRSETFMKMLSGLFGDPGVVLAPRRLGVFKLDGTIVKYRQAQTWSLVRKPPLILTGSVPTGGWPNYRTSFVNDASLKFGRIPIAEEPIGTDRLKTMLTNAAANATTAFGATFFLEEGIQIFPQGSQTAAAAVASLAPRSNGDPVTAKPKSALDLDDTTVVTTISGSDAYPTNTARTKFAITVAILAQIIDKDVSIADGPAYREVTTSKGLAPSPGPKPVGGGSASSGVGSSDPGTVNAELQAIIDELLAGGAAQSDIDALLAAIPPDDATEDAATGVASVDETFPGEGPDYMEPGPEEPV